MLRQFAFLTVISGLISAAPINAQVRDSVIKGQSERIRRDISGSFINPVKSYRDTLFDPVKELNAKLLLNEVFPMADKKVRVDSSFVFYQATFMDRSVYQELYPSNTHFYGIGTNIYLTELPFQLQYQSNSGFINNYQSMIAGLPKFNFNHAGYLNKLRTKVTDKVQPEQLIDMARNRYNLIKQKFQQQLEAELSGMMEDYSNTYDKVIKVSTSELKIEEIDRNQLVNKLVPADWKQKYAYHQRRAEELGKLPASANRDSLWRESLTVLQEYSVREKMIKKVLDARKNFSENTLVSELKKQIQFPEQGFKQAMQNPSKLVGVLKENASMSGFQKLFLHFTKFNLGANSIGTNSMDLNQVMTNGIDLEFMSKKFSVGGVYGSGNLNQNINALQGASTFLTNEYNKLAGIKVGSGWDSKIKQSVSFNMFSFSTISDRFGIDPVQLNLRSIQGPARQDVVVTYQSSIKLGGSNEVKLDLSKSFGSYDNSLGVDSSFVGKQNTSQLFGNNGKQNWAAGISYIGFIYKTKVNSGIQHAGLGYNNPGNFSIRRGETRVFWDFSRKFLNSKLSVSYRGDLRKQQLDPAKIYTFSSFSSNGSIAYRFRRNTRIGLQYREARNVLESKASGQPNTGGNRIVQATGQFTSKWLKLPVQHVFIIAHQAMEVPLVNNPSYKSKSTQFTYQQVIPVKAYAISTNLMYNRSSNKEYLFNTTFLNLESLFSYGLFKKMSASSGLGYYDNENWNKQIGLRQQFTVRAWKRIDLMLDLSWRKAVQVENPLLSSYFYGTTSCMIKF